MILPYIVTVRGAAPGSCSCSSSSWSKRPARGEKSRPEWRGNWEPNPGPWASGSGPDPFPGFRAEPAEAARLRRLASGNSSDRWNGKKFGQNLPETFRFRPTWVFFPTQTSEMTSLVRSRTVFKVKGGTLEPGKALPVDVRVLWILEFGFFRRWCWSRSWLDQVYFDFCSTFTFVRRTVWPRSHLHRSKQRHVSTPFFTWSSPASTAAATKNHNSEFFLISPSFSFFPDNFQRNLFVSMI